MKIGRLVRAGGKLKKISKEKYEKNKGQQLYISCVRWAEPLEGGMMELCTFFDVMDVMNPR
jgi:hypothetical protein